MSALVALLFGLQKAVIQGLSVAALSVTQVILPVAIISTVVVVRNVSPPQTVDPCQYRGINMPSEGTLSFMQSFACNLDNQCLPPNYTQTPNEAVANSRFKRLDQSLTPILTSQPKMNNLKKLPKAVDAIIKVGDSAAANNLSSLLDSLSMTIGSLFYNESLVIDFLSVQTRLLTPEAARALMNGRLNLTSLISAFGGKSITDITCDPNLLVQYLSVNYEGDKNSSIASQISTALCSVNSSKASEISDFLFRQFDIGKALRLFKQVSAFTYNYNLTQAIGDLETLMRLLPQFEVLRNLDRLSVSNWAVALIQQLQKLIYAPGLLTDAAYLTKTGEQLMELLSALVSNDPTARTQFNMIKSLLASGQRILGMLIQLQSLVLNSTLDKILPPDVLNQLLSRGIALSDLQATPVTLSGLMHLMQMDPMTSTIIVTQLCTGTMELTKMFNPPASNPMMMDQVQAFVCSNSTRIATLNLTQFLNEYFVTAASLNVSQLVRDAMSLGHVLSGNGSVLVSQIMSIFSDPTWANALRTNATQVPSDILKALASVLDQAIQGPTERSALLFGAHFLLLQAEALKMKATLEQDFSRFVLTDSRVSAWVSAAAAAFPGMLIQQSLFSVPLHYYMFAYTQGLASSAEVKQLLCNWKTLAEIVDYETRFIFVGNSSSGGAQADKVVQLFCNHSDVFAALGDVFRAKHTAIMSRAMELTKLTNFSALPTIVDAFNQWTQLEKEQQMLQQNSTWTQQAIHQLSNRVNATSMYDRVTVIRSRSSFELHGLVLNMLAGFYMVEMVNPPLFWWWKLPMESVVANINVQTASLMLANILYSTTQRDKLVLAMQTPQGATVLGLSMQLAMQMTKRPPTSPIVFQQPARPMCNGSYLTEFIPVLGDYPAGVKLNSSLCQFLAISPDVRAMWEPLMNFMASLTSSNFTGSPGQTLTRALLSNLNQHLLLQFELPRPQSLSTLDITSLTSSMKLLSLAYELFYGAVTSNATDPVTADILLQTNFALNAQFYYIEFLRQFLADLNSTRDLQKAVLNSPELSELMASLPQAVKDLMRSALNGSLEVNVPTNISSLCVDIPASSLFGAIGSMPSVTRFGNALCAAIRTLPAGAMSKYGPLIDLLQPSAMARLSYTKYNLTQDWMVTEQVIQLVTDLTRLQITQILPEAVNITDLTSFVNQYIMEFNTLISGNWSTLLDTMGQLLLRQLQTNPMIGPPLQQYMNSAVQLLSQLNGLMKASNYSATGLVSGTELNNFVTLFNQAPALLPSLLKTIYEAQANPSALAAAWTPVITNPSLICTNATLFSQLMRTPDTVDPAALQADLCRAVNFNYTVLLAQLFQRLPAVQLIINQLNCLSTGCVPSTSGNATILELFAAMQAQSAEFANMVTKISPGGVRLEIFNSSYLAMLIAPELERFAMLGNASLDVQLQNYLQIYSTLIWNLLSSMNMNGTTNMDVLIRLLEWNHALFDIVLGGPARLEAMLNQTADGQRLWRLLISLPAMTQVVTHTATQHPNRMGRLQIALTSSFNASLSGGGPVLYYMCKWNFSEFLAVPLGVSFDTKAFQHDLCSLNLTSPATLPPPLNTLFSMTGGAAITPESLMNAMNSMSSGNWTAVPQIWMPFLQQWSTAIASSITATPSLEMAFYQIDAALMNLPPELFAPINSVMSLANYLLDMTLGSVNLLLARNSSSVSDALYQLPETQKLLGLVSENFTEIMVAAVSNQRAIQYLLTLNETEAFMYLCLSRNATLMAFLGMSNFSLVSPPGVCVGCLVDKLCTVNIIALEQEVSNFGMSLTGAWTSTSRMSFAVLSGKAMQLQSLVMQLAAKSSVSIPGMFQAANWNAAITILQPTFQNASSILSTSQDLLLTIYLSLRNPRDQAAFAAVLSDVMRQLTPRVEAFLATTNLYEFIKGMPLLDALYNITALDGGTAVLRVVLDATVLSPGKLAELILNPSAAAEAFGKLCNGSFDLASLLAINSTQSTISVQRALCTVLSDTSNTNALAMRFLEQLGVSSIFIHNGVNASSTANLTAIQAQAQTFFKGLQAISTTSSDGLMPRLNVTTYLEVFYYLSGLIGGSTSPEAQRMMLQYYSTLYTLLKTYLSAADFQRTQDIINGSISFLQAVADYTGSALYGSPGPITLELSKLVANVSSAQSVLDQLLKPHNLTGLRVNTGRLSQLYNRAMSNASYLCSMDPNEYFVLPPTLDGNALRESICRLAVNFQTEIIGNMDLVKLMQAVSGLTTPNKTLEFNGVWKFYTSIVFQSTILGRLNNVTYRGVPVGSLLQMSPPDLQNLFPDVITVSGQMNLIFGVAESIAGSIDSLTPASKDPVVATLLRVTHAALATIQSIFKSWSVAGEINLSVVFRNATLWIELLSNTTVSIDDIGALINMTLQADKLTALLSRPMGIQLAICNSTSGFSEYFNIGPAVPALDKVFYYIFCDLEAQNRLRNEFLVQTGISAILEATTSTGNGTSVSMKETVVQIRQLVDQVALVIQRPFVINTNGTVIESLMKLIGTDIIGQLGRLLQTQFGQPNSVFNFLPPLLEAAYSLFKSSMPRETAQLDLGMAIAYEIISRANSEVTNTLGRAITMETLLRPDNVLSPLLKSLDATDANTLTLLVQAVLNNTEFDRWLKMGFTNALCKEDLNQLFVSNVPMNLSALQASICTLTNSSALMSALGSMFNSKNSLVEMLTSMTVRQSVSATQLYTVILQLSNSLQGVGSVNTSALDAKILSMINALQAGSSGLLANYQSYLTGSLSVLGQLTLHPHDLALLGAVTGKLEQSVGLLSTVYKMVIGQGSPTAFFQALSTISMNERLASTIVYARGSQPMVTEMCSKLNQVFTSPADAAAVNASICQRPPDAWWQAKMSWMATNQMFTFLTGENATVSTLPWKAFEPTLTSVLSLGNLLIAAPGNLNNVSLPALQTMLQQLVMHQSLGPTLATLIAEQISPFDEPMVKRTLEITNVFLSIMLTVYRDNVTNALSQPGAINQLLLVANSGYFQVEINVLISSPEYAMLSGSNLNSTLCDLAQFEAALPNKRLSIASTRMFSPNDSRVDAELASLQRYLCEGASKNMLMLQQLENLANLSNLMKLANSFRDMSVTQLMQELISGNSSITTLSQVLSNPNALLQIFNQFSQSLMPLFTANWTSPESILTSSLTQTCVQLQSYDQILWTANGTSLTMRQFFAILINNTNLIESALCDLAKFNLSAAASKMTNVISLLSNPSRPIAISDCSKFSDLFFRSRVAACWSNQTAFFENFSARMSDYSMFLQLANQASQLQTLIGPEAATYLAQIFRSISSGVKSQVTLQNILANSSMSLDQFARLLDVSKEYFNQIIGSTITFNSSLIASMSDIDIYNALCSPHRINQIMSFPPVLAVNMSLVSKAICDQMAISTSDRQGIILLIRGATAPNLAGLDLSSWIRALTSLNNLMEELNKLQSIRDLLNNFDIRRMSEYEAAILALMRSFPGEQIQQIGYSLVRDLQKLFNDPVWTSLMADLNTFFRSLRLFDFAKPLFPIKLQVKDFVDDPNAVTQYLVRQGIPVEVSGLILNSYLSSEQLFNFSLKLSIPEALCNPAKLKSLVDFFNVTYNVSSLVEQLCVNMTLRDAENITETILRMGNFGRFFTRNFAQQMVDSLLNSSGVTVSDLKDAVQAVVENGNELQNTFDVMLEISNVISSYNTGSGGIDSPSGLEGVSQAVCGTSNKFVFRTVYGLNLDTGSSGNNNGASGRRRRRRSTPDSTYVYELGPLASSGFCRNLYDLTQQSTAGRVGWTYVKPIIRGRVIVTPDTNETRQLMRGVQEEFTKLLNLQELSRSLGGLVPNGNATSSASVLSSLLSNPLASSAFSSILGPSANLTSVQSLLEVFTRSSGGNSTSSTQILELLQNFTSCVETDRLDFYPPSSSQYDSNLQSALSENRLLAVIAFDNLPTRRRRDVAPGSSGLPAHVKYTIRMPHGTLYRTDALTAYPEIYEKRDSFTFDLAYQRGFVQLQESIDRMIVRIQTGREMPPQQTKQMPTPCLKDDSMLQSFGLAILPICTIFMWLAPLAIAMQQIMYDREHSLEIPLFLMGLRPTIHFLQWFFVQLLNMLILSVIISLAVVYGGILSGTDPSIIFVLFALFSFSVLGYGYMVSAFFTTSSVACVIALLIYLLMFVPFIFVSYLHVGGSALHAINIFSPTTFSLAARSIVALQLANYRVTWADMLKDTYGMVVYANFLALALDAICYFLIGWYFRNVLPGKHGVPQSPLFFLTARYWGCDSSQKKMDVAGRNGAVVKLTNVCKKFGSKYAVNNLNLTLREGETTILLGPNGAGKSTTIKMITGLITCDSGKVIVNGLNVATSFYKLRSTIGFCPQHNVYYEDLSVKRNLAYFGALKGCSKSELEDMLISLRLYKVRNVAVRHLSGGQKRRLSIGLAFLGQPSLVILDEPTAAVDPEARRTIWELIKKHRCTTLICTHDMQEAEVLGDHVTVMMDGSIIDSKSYTELFETCRYTVKISSNSPQALAEELRTQSLAISEPAINERKKRVQLTCPNDGRVLASLTKGLDHLKSTNQLLSWFSITCSTVSDYFNGLIFGKEVIQDSPQAIRYEKYPGKPKTAAKIGALFIKRFNHASRSWISYIGMMLLPCAFIVLAMGATLLRPSISQESAKLLLTPTIYGPGAVSFLYQEAGFSMKEAIRSSLAQPPGIGTGCMPGENRGKMPFFTAPCKDTTSTWDFKNFTAAELAKYATYRNCTCDKAKYSCADEYSKGLPPDVLVTPSGDVIHELRETTSLDDLLVRSTTRFNLSGPRSVSFAPAGNQRWGGFQLKANSSVIWFDNRGYHTLPSYLNAYSNAMLRLFVSSSNYSNYSSEYGISTYNYPLPMMRSQLNTDTFDIAIKDAGLAMCIVFALCFVPASISLTVSNERASGERVHLRLYGIGIPTYWLTSFVWDMIMFMVPLGLVTAIMAAFQIDLYTANVNLPAIVMLIALFGASAIPFSYLVSRMLRSPAGGFLLSLFLLFFMGIVVFSLLLLLQFYVTFSNKDLTIQVLTYVFMALPSFSLGNGVYRIVENQFKATVLKGYGADEYANPFTMGMIGPHAISMGVGCVVFLLINMLIDIHCRCCNNKVRYSSLTDGGSDVGVQEESDRVNSGACRNDPIQLIGLRMSFRTVRGFRIQALDNLTMSVKEGICLGLLGPNGSGKSTTFNILTKQLAGYNGYCSIEGLSYCPQSDPLDKEITVTETLIFYARLLGLSRRDRDRQVDQLISALRLPPNKVTKALSGGQRRKLSVAIAFLGAPRCILLDEPSAGLDAVSRAALKQLVRCAIAQKSCVLFTSHCMEEVEGVCDRVAILVGGRLRAIGSMDELKEQLGRSFTLTVRTSRGDKENLTKYLQNTFPSAECKMSAAGVFEYAVPITTKLHEIFAAMENIRGQLCSEYTVKQTTLEQVFLELCSHQTDSWREDGSLSGSGSSNPYGSSDSPPSSSAGSTVPMKQGKRSADSPDYFSGSGTLHSLGTESGSEKARVYKVYL